MKLVPNAKRVALRSYSMWAIYLGIICLLLPEGLLYFLAMDTDPFIWWATAMALLIFGAVGRLIVQPEIRSWKRMLVLSVLFLLLIWVWAKPVIAQPTEHAFLNIAVPHVAKWEGKRNTAYLDSIANPPVWTVCYGETRGVKQGDFYTDEQCSNMLAHGLIEYRTKIHKYFTSATLRSRLTPERDTAYVSLGWNAGINAVGNSTATKRLNAGDISGGCKAITWWNRAGKYVIRGLVNRRSDEYKLCMIGL